MGNSRNILFLVLGALLSFALVGCSLFEPKNSTEPVVEMPRAEKKVSNINKKRSDVAGPRHRLMILPFLDQDEARPQSLRDEARTTFIEELNLKTDLIVVDSKDLKVSFNNYLHNGEYKLAELAKAAKDLGVAAMLEGKLLDIKVRSKSDAVGVFRQMKTTFECKARVRIVSARTGKELFNTVKTVTIDEANTRVGESVDKDRFFKNNPEILENLVKETFLDFAPQIANVMGKLSWEGRIAMITGERVFLNVGQVSGLQIGDILKVSEDGDEIYDPQTGNFIGKAPGRLKGTLEVISYFGQDGAISVVHSGSGFRENDRVQLY